MGKNLHELYYTYTLKYKTLCFPIEITHNLFLITFYTNMPLRDLNFKFLYPNYLSVNLFATTMMGLDH